MLPVVGVWVVEDTEGETEEWECWKTYGGARILHSGFVRAG